MMKKVSIILACAILFTTALSNAVCAEDVRSFEFTVDGIDITITSGEDISRELAYQIALYLFDEENRTSPQCEMYGHKFVAVTAITVVHNCYSTAPRCKEYVYSVKTCSVCGKTERTLLDSNRIYCCDGAIPFNDVPSGAWYADAAVWCSARGYMTGTAQRRFSPDAPLTRAMFAAILAKVDGANLTAYTGAPFRDVPAGEWYSKPIQWANKNGYTSGVGGGYFGTDVSVTREQLAVFLFNYSQKKGRDVSALASLSPYSDKGSVSSWAVNGVRWAVKAGLISGTTAATLSPKRPATRAEVALIIRNYVENVKG